MRAELVKETKEVLREQGYEVYYTPFFKDRNIKMFGMFDIMAIKPGFRPLLIYVAEDENEKSYMVEKIKHFFMRYNVGLDLGVSYKDGNKIKIWVDLPFKKMLEFKSNKIKNKEKQLKLF